MKFVSVLFCILLGSAAAYSQNVYTPERGSAERKSIMDALRVPIEKQLGQKIIFAADNFNVQGAWAFLSGTPQSPGGGTPDYSGTVYAENGEAGAFDNNFFAILRKTGSRWKVVKYAIGCTDVCYADWWRRYKAPKAIFPYTE